MHEYPHSEQPQASSDDFAPFIQTQEPTSPDRPEREPLQDAGHEDAAAAAIDPVALALGDRSVRKEDVIAFIHFGHSNMAGRANEPASERDFFFTPDAHAWMYHVGEKPEPAREPFTAGDARSVRENLAGPGMALLKQAIARAPDKHFLSLGFGHSSARCTHYLPGGLYHEAMTQAAAAIRDRVTFGAVFIMLGITENPNQADFANCIEQVVSSVRELVGRPDLPVLLSDYEREASGELAVDGMFALSLLPQIQKVPELVPNCGLVPTEGIDMQDDHHFSLLGHKLWASRALDVMVARGWFPWSGESSPAM